MNPKIRKALAANIVPLQMIYQDLSNIVEYLKQREAESEPLQIEVGEIAVTLNRVTLYLEKLVTQELNNEK